MIDPQTGKTAFRLALFITVIALALLPFQDPASAEFVVTVLSALVGLVTLAIVVLVVRKSGS